MLSIIIPVYNASKYLPNCLKSIFSQTYDDFELIIVNDGSTDDTLAIINEFAEKYFQYDIKVFTTENNGHALARNYGINKATREYIWFIDADDVLYDNNAMLNTVNDLQKHSPDILIFSAFETDYDKRKKIWNYTRKNKTTTIKKSPFLFFKQNWSWNKLIKNEFLLNSKMTFPDLKMFEDVYFYVDLYQVANSIYITRDIRYVYIKHSTSLTASMKNFKSYPKALWYEFKNFIKVIFSLK